MFEYNIRNLISKSVPYVTPQPKEPTTTKKPNQKHFRISREVKSTHKVQMEKMKKGYISIHQQLGIIANLRERGCLENKEGIRSRKNKVTFYMNNFMKTKYSKAKKQSIGSECRRKRGLRESTEGSEIFPWRSFEGEEDGLMPG